MESVLLINCMTVAAVSFIVIAYRFWMVKKETRKLPSGTMGFPLIGETLEFMFYSYTTHPEAFMTKRRLKYGKVFKSHLFGNKTIVSTDAEINKFIMQGDMTVLVPDYPKSIKELMGESSILFTHGSLHKKVHGLIGSFLKSPGLKSQVTADMQHYIQMSMSCWKDDQIIPIQDASKEVIYKILVKGLVGMEAGKYIDLLRLHFHQFIAGLVSLPFKIPGSTFYKSLQAKKKLVQLMKSIIGERRRMRKNEKNMVPSPVKDMIDAFINDGSDELTDDHVVSNLINLMIPGNDSVPALIALVVKNLSESPLALRQIEEENMQLKKTKTDVGMKLVWRDYASLSFTQDVITESLRMGNIVTSVIRKAMTDIEIKGHFIPKGWSVMAYIRTVHYDDDFYEDPYKFNPWRWQNQKKDMGRFSPFGGGQRLCPGVEFARLEASIYIHHLITSFSWVAQEDMHVSWPTPRMRKGMPVKIKRKI